MALLGFQMIKLPKSFFDLKQSTECHGVMTRGTTGMVASSTSCTDMSRQNFKIPNSIDRHNKSTPFEVKF